jgi:hypothetical protein
MIDIAQVASIGTFIAIAGAMVAALWDTYRGTLERTRRLEKARER